jgi:DNA-binding response OmpR family regulator
MMGASTMAILLVDDEERLRQTLALSLRARGHQVVQAVSHSEAVAAVLSTSFDLLLIDINLSDATGWDVLRDLKSAGHHIPAIVISAVPPSTARVREFNPIAVLHKPFPIDALLRLVRPLAGGDGALPRSAGGS